MLLWQVQLLLICHSCHLYSRAVQITALKCRGAAAHDFIYRCRNDTHLHIGHCEHAFLDSFAVSCCVLLLLQLLFEAQHP